jgi:ABC-type lipoprotein export system ATPase subunit
LVHLIYGLRKDYDGTLTLHGNNAQDNDLEAWANLRQTKLSIVFQDLRLFLNLTGLENIQLKANLTNTTSLDEILRMAKHLGVSDYLNRPCATLSYGQRQRIAIIRALCQPFEWLMLDEPFSHLDTENIRLATELIEEKLAAQNAGLIIVTLGDTYFFQYDSRIIV